MMSSVANSKVFLQKTAKKLICFVSIKKQLWRLSYSFSSYKIFFAFILVLTAVVIVNESVEKKNSTRLTEELKNAALTSVEESLCQRYLTKLISAKQEKAQVGYMPVLVLKGVIFFSNITSVKLLLSRRHY